MKKGPASLRKISVVTGAVRALVGAGTLLVAFANTGHSATIQATGVSGIEVQAAIDLAREGDTVRVPAGAASWTAQVNILNKGIKLIGAGIGNTVITRAVPGQGDNALYVRGYATNFVLIQGFTWNTVSVAQYGQVCVESRIHTDPACQVRVTQCRFEISPAGVQSSRGLVFIGTYGLVDHCYFYNHSGNGQTSVAEVSGDQALIMNWHRPIAYGTTNAMVVEDCVFDHTTVADGIDAYSGTIITYRYNVVTNSLFGGHGADSAPRGARLAEFYMNKFYTSGGYKVWTAMELRGGSGVIWSNYMDSGYNSLCALLVYRADPDYAVCCGGVPVGSPSDGNFDKSYPGQGYGVGYPLLDQIGRGSFTSASVPNCSGGCTTNAYEALEPVYQWGNNWNGNTSPRFFPRDFNDTPNIANYIKEGRDYYNNTVKPGYRPLAYPHPLISGTSQSQGPTISDIPDQFTTVNTATPAIGFTVADSDTALGALTLTGSSSNPTLVPNNNIAFGGSGANRTVSVTPAAGQTGNSTITVRVSDGTNTANDTFVLTVAASNTAPTISTIANQSVNEDTSTAALAFTVGDAETGASSVTLSAGSSNTGLVPVSNIVFGGSGANRTVTVSPAANQSGSATITVTASDGQLTGSRNFTVTINAVNDAPTISSIADQSVNTNATTGPISFTVGDVETAATSLTVSGGSSNPSLVPANNIIFGGSGANRAVTVTPVAGQSGSSTITVTVSDGQLTANSTFAVNVRAGATYYVDNGSAAANDVATNGSEAKPWRTITYAMSRIAGGDTILVKNGTYNEDGLYVYGPSGAAGAETVLKAYPGHRPVFKGTGNTGRIAIDNVGYMIIDGFDIWNLNQCVYIRNASHHITVRNCVIHDSGNEAVHVNGNSHDILVANNVIFNAGSIGNQVNGEGIYVGVDPLPIDNTYNVTIRNNLIYNVFSEAIELKPGTHDCIVENNETYANNTGSLKFCAICADETLNYGNPNHVVRNNVIHDSGSGVDGIWADTGCVVYNNVIYGVAAGNSGISINNRQNDTWTRRIYHNTIWHSSTRAVTVTAGTADVKNNIGPTTANNLGTNTAYFVNVPGHDFHLLPGTAPVDAGVDVSSFAPLDFDGNARPSGVRPDMGAFEYTSNRPSPPQNLRIVSQQ